MKKPPQTGATAACTTNCSYIVVLSWQFFLKRMNQMPAIYLFSRGFWVSYNSIIWVIYLVDASKFPWFCKIKSPFIISYRFVCVLLFFHLSWWNKTFQSCIFFVRLPVDLLLIVALLLYYQNNHLSMIPRYINFISNEESCKRLLQAHPFWEFVTCPVVRMSWK